MIVSYYFSSPEGDVLADDATLARPFIVRPFETHPFMTLGDYFAAIRDFVLREGWRPLALLLSKSWGRKVSPDEIERVLIRYEKYGTLYQIASATVQAGGQVRVFAVTTAMSPSAKGTLDREFDLLQELNGRMQPSYLPEVYYKEMVTVNKEEGTEDLLMTFSEWFEGFHEWHFSKDREGREGIIIWDMGGGFRFASEYEAHEIIKRASTILTLHYRSDTYHHISPWHHGAGDFVVKTDGQQAVEVKLVTVRGYDPIVASAGPGKVEPLGALFLFLLNSSVKMRLDRQEGMGEPLWAEAAVLDPMLKGFFQGLKMKESRGGLPGVTIDDLNRYLKSLGENRIGAILLEHLREYGLYDPSDAAFVQVHVREHARDLRQAIGNFFSE
jgi:hypothetical protein